MEERRVTSRDIRPATVADLPDIMSVLEAARGIMRSDGNVLQWADAYPSEPVIRHDMARGAGYVICLDGRVVAYFAFLPSPEPTYSFIDGAWLDAHRPYHVIHRIGSLPDVHGVFDAMMEFAFAADGNIRIDTHRDNHIMQHNILKHGFTYCGIIFLESGDERLAYQKVTEDSY